MAPEHPVDSESVRWHAHLAVRLEADPAKWQVPGGMARSLARLALHRAWFTDMSRARFTDDHRALLSGFDVIFSPGVGRFPVLCKEERDAARLGVHGRQHPGVGALDDIPEDHALKPFFYSMVEALGITCYEATRSCFAGQKLYKEGAALIAAQCKSGLLRTPNTIQQFKNVQPPPGQTSPILHYFSTLLEYGKLNALESVELLQPVVQQGRRELVEKWLKEDKLECTEELGDIVKPLDGKFALSIYLRASVHAKVIQSFVEQGQIDQIVAYAKKVGYQADYSQLLQGMVASNPEGATNFAKALLEGKDGVPLIDINKVVKVFMDQNRLQETTSILLDALKANRPDQSALQTQLLAMNLQQAPKVAEAILQMNMFTHYDRSYIGQLCEKAGLMQYALEHYSDAADLKRVMLHAHQMTPEFLINHFSKMAPELALECLYDLMRHNRQNLNMAVQVAIKYHEQIGAVKIVEMFDSFGSNEGVFYFVGAILSASTDSEVHFSYIKAASRCGNMQEVERVCRESTSYDPVQVKDFLKEAKLPDPRPLIYVCDLHDFVEELTDYLYKNSLMKYIEVYVVKVNPLKCPFVVGALIDLDCSEDFIKSLLQNVRAACPCEPLVKEVEKRNRLKVILPWLEARVAEGNQEPSLHNAMAMILIDTN
ncbi:unnamed protein product, partial [Polarella glacialis]